MKLLVTANFPDDKHNNKYTFVFKIYIKIANKKLKL